MSRKPVNDLDDLDERDDDDREAASSGPGGVNELIRRMATLGLAGFFTTESAIRRAFGDTVPRDWIEFANEQSERTRREVIDRMAQELGKQFAEMDMNELLSRFLAGHTVEINAKVKLTPRDERDPKSGLRTHVEFETE